jgi:hypothetical protein
VDVRDHKAFLKAFKSKQFQPRYVAYFDHDSDGDVDRGDLVAFNRPQRTRQLHLGDRGDKPGRPRVNHSANVHIDEIVHQHSSTTLDLAAVDEVFAEIELAGRQ